MASTIKIRRSAIQGAIPTTSQLSLGELGINTFDGKLFLKQSTTGSETGAGTTIVDVTGYSYDWVTNESGIHTSSNVGIGTTNPDGPLVINAASGFTGNLLDLQVGGASSFAVVPSFSGSILKFGPSAYLHATTQSGQSYATLYSQPGIGLRVRSDQGFVVEGVSLSFAVSNSAATVTLARDADDTLAQRRGTNAQTFRLYNTYTDASNYERFSLSWNSNVLNIANEANGTGTLRGIAFNANGDVSTPPVSLTGTWFTGGDATTTKPQLLIEPSGTTSTAWSTNGTGLGVNAATGFSGNMLDIQKEGASRFNITSFGTANLYVQAGFTNEGLSIGATNSSAKTKLTFQDGLFFSGAGTFDVVLRSDAAADTLAQRRGTNAQTLRVYDTYTSATDYHRIAIATARATLSAVLGASVTATGLIPAGAVVMGVTSKVTTALGTTNSTTGYKIGTVVDDDRWGDITGTAAGTSSDNRDWTSGTIECFPSATDIIVTAVGGDFDGIGEIYLSVQYMSGQVD